MVKRTLLLSAVVLLLVGFAPSSAQAKDPTPGSNFGECVSNYAAGEVDEFLQTFCSLLLGETCDSMRDFRRAWGPWEANVGNATARASGGDTGVLLTCLKKSLSPPKKE